MGKNVERINIISKEIEEMVWSLDLSYLDACVHWANLNNYEIETVIEVVKHNKALQSLIETEAKNLRLVR